MRRTWHIATNSVVVTWLASAAVVAVLHRQIAVADWLMVHMLGLGALTNAILIWSSHFAQTVRRRPLPGGRGPELVRLVAANVGALTVITGMVTSRWPVILVGGVVVASAVFWHGWVIASMARGRSMLLAGGFGWMTRYYVASALALTGGVGAGITMANESVGADLAARAYVTHTVLMLLGWIGLTVVGTLITLWPTLVRSQITTRAKQLGKAALWVLSAGLLLVVAAAVFDLRTLVAAGLAVYTAGLMMAFTPHALLMRGNPAISFASLSVGAAGIWLVGTVAWWAGNVLTAGSWAEAQIRTAGALFPLLVGVGAQVLLGSLSHLVPVVLGGGPRGAAAAIQVVNRAGDARLIMSNLALLGFVFWRASWVRVTLSVLILAVLVGTLVLVVKAAFAARRVARENSGEGGRDLELSSSGKPALPVAAKPDRGGSASRVAAVVGVLAIAGVGVAIDPVAAGFTSASAPVEPTGVVVEVDVVAVEMRFEPSSITVNAGDHLIVNLTNSGDQVHDLVFPGGQTSGRLAPGQSAQIDVGIVGPTTQGWCSVAGHRQMGMVFDVLVAGGDPAAHPHPTDGIGATTHLDLQGEPGPNAMLQDALLPAAVSGVPGEPTVHRHTFAVTETEVEVGPGVTQTVWTFNGSVPGPTLRGKVGDIFEITLVNDGSMGHSIDFHAGALAPNEPMRTIQPGETLTYSFTATRSGIWMYHCSTMPMSLHIAAGMFGAVIIDPPDLPPVDHEFVLVQSEWYLGEQGGLPSMDKIKAGVPDLVTFNGYPFQYRHSPLRVGVDERVRVWVLNVGLDRPSTFHVVGGQFDTVFFEGAYLLGAASAPADGFGSQAFGLLPAQGGFVEFALPEAGDYPFVTHLMADAERGAAGLFKVD